MCSPHPQPSCPRGAPRTQPAIRGLLLPPLCLETRAPIARASRLTRERETRRPARGAQRRPLPSWPLPSPTSTAPAPHPRDPPGAARQPPGYTTQPATGGGGPRASSAPAVQGDKATAGGDPEHSAPPRRVPLDTLPPPLLSAPESVTGIGFQHGGQEAAPRGGENIPAAPAPGGAGPESRPREEPRGPVLKRGV